MKWLKNRKIWVKILVVVLLVLVFQLALPKPSNAAVTSAILKPITELFANIGDGIMEIMQKTFLGMETSGVWVVEKSGLWLKILIAVIVIAAAVIAVAATVASGGLALTIFLSAAGAVIKIATGGAIAFFAVNTLHLGESRILFARISTYTTSDISKRYSCF